MSGLSNSVLIPWIYIGIQCALHCKLHTMLGKCSTVAQSHIFGNFEKSLLNQSSGTGYVSLPAVNIFGSWLHLNSPGGQYAYNFMCCGRQGSIFHILSNIEFWFVLAQSDNQACA